VLFGHPFTLTYFAGNPAQRAIDRVVTDVSSYIRRGLLECADVSANLIAGIRLAREKEATLRAIATTNAINKSMELGSWPTKCLIVYWAAQGAAWKCDFHRMRLPQPPVLDAVILPTISRMPGYQS
jgi:hypothetical protein